MVSVSYWTLLLLPLIALCFGEPVNKEVTRVVDATSAILKVNIEIKVVGATDGFYDFVLPTLQAQRLALMQASFQSKTVDISAPVS